MVKDMNRTSKFYVGTFDNTTEGIKEYKLLTSLLIKPKNTRFVKMYRGKRQKYTIHSFNGHSVENIRGCTKKADGNRFDVYILNK